MSHDPAHFSPVFSIDVSAEATSNAPPKPTEVGAALVALTRQLIDTQQRQNLLLDQILQVNKQVLQASNQANAQRQNELTQWRNAHPKLVRSCKQALETLSNVQTEFLQNLADEVADSKDALSESDYVFTEFLDRFGPRMAHLNGILQVLNHLGG
ncbi:MAG: hypothetical protein ABL921_03200 [Pirellula sp.]